MPGQNGRGLRDQGALLGFVPVALALGIGAAMPDDLIAAGPERLDEAGAIRVEAAVDEDARGQIQGVQGVLDPPGADPVAPVAPSVVEDVRLRPAGCEFGAEAAAEIEALEVEREIDGEPLAPGQS